MGELHCEPVLQHKAVLVAEQMLTMTGTIFDNFPPPPSAKLLGWRLISLDTAAGEIELGFDGKPEFLNPMGIVQGGSSLRCSTTRWDR